MVDKKKSSKKFTIEKFTRDLTLGGLSGFVAKTLIVPFEKAKILLRASAFIPKLIDRPYTGIINCISRSIK